VDQSKHSNSKTILSFDTTTICPRRREGLECEYCYVKAARATGIRAKTEFKHCEYVGFVKRLRPDVANRLASAGGIRMFSFGDYCPAHKKDVQKFLNDCQDCNRSAKAITKSLQFVEDWNDHPALAVFHLSVDRLKGTKNRSPISIALARRYRRMYTKVLIRAVALSDEDVKAFGEDETVDILTLNHGNNGFKQFSPKAKADIGRLYGKVCCLSPDCSTCELRCGVDKIASIA